MRDRVASNVWQYRLVRRLNRFEVRIASAQRQVRKGQTGSLLSFCAKDNKPNRVQRKERNFSERKHSAIAIVSSPNLQTLELRDSASCAIAVSKDSRYSLVGLNIRVFVVAEYLINASWEAGTARSRGFRLRNARPDIVGDACRGRKSRDGKSDLYIQTIRSLLGKIRTNARGKKRTLDEAGRTSGG